MAAGRKKIEAVHWTLERAAAEFGIDRKTLSKKLLGIMPETAAHYTTGQICAAIYGDLEKAKIRQAEATAATQEIELATLRGKMVEVSAVENVWRKICEAVRLRISESTLPKDEQTTILAELRTLRLSDYSTADPDSPPGT